MHSKWVPWPSAALRGHHLCHHCEMQTGAVGMLVCRALSLELEGRQDMCTQGCQLPRKVFLTSTAQLVLGLCELALHRIAHHLMALHCIACCYQLELVDEPCECYAQDAA